MCIFNFMAFSLAAAAAAAAAGRERGRETCASACIFIPSSHLHQYWKRHKKQNSQKWWWVKERERDRAKCTGNIFSPWGVRGAMLKGSANGPAALPAVAGVFPCWHSDKWLTEDDNPQKKQDGRPGRRGTTAICQGLFLVKGSSRKLAPARLLKQTSSDLLLLFVPSGLNLQRKIAKTTNLSLEKNAVVACVASTNLPDSLCRLLKDRSIIMLQKCRLKKEKKEAGKLFLNTFGVPWMCSLLCWHGWHEIEVCSVVDKVACSFRKFLT